MATTSNDAAAVKQNMKGTKIQDPTIEAFKSMQKAVRTELINCKPGEEWDTLLRTLQHNVDAQPIKDDVLAAFQRHYSGEFYDDQLHAFGSTVMGLQLKDSDVDFYVELPNGERTKAAKKIQNEMVKGILEASERTKTAKKIPIEMVMGILEANERTKTAKKIQIEMVKGILVASEKFARFETSTRPRIPIVRCVHIATMIKCDFNCSNGFGTLNSPIIAHLLNFDPRIRQLAIIIKYWMKIHRCSGRKRISNYAAVWMLIFYLQTLPQPIVPPIYEFQRNVPPSMYTHYNFAFDYSIQNRTENRSQLPELLLGFFKFYRDFDYVGKLICPLYGKTLNKTDVARRKNLVELQRYNQTFWDNRHTEHPMFLDEHAICIQDPFEILRKVPGEILKKQHEEIHYKICYAAEIMECELPKGDTKSLFSQIFDVDKFDQYDIQKEKAKVPPIPIVEAERCGYLSITSVCSKDAKHCSMTFRMKPTNFILKNAKWTNLANNGTAPTDERSMKKRWAQEVIEMVVDILDKIFNLDLDLDLDDDDHHDDGGGGDEFVKTFDLTGARDVFLGREKQWVCDKTWNLEVQDSSRRFDLCDTPEIPFNLSATIVADTTNFDFISIEFSDEIRTKKKNFYGKFCHEFVNRIDYFLQVYFVHRSKSRNIKSEQKVGQPQQN